MIMTSIYLYLLVPLSLCLTNPFSHCKKYLLSIEHVAVGETDPDFMVHVAPSWLGRRGTEHVQTGALNVSDGAVRGTAGAHVQKEPTRSEGLSEEVET